MNNSNELQLEQMVKEVENLKIELMAANVKIEAYKNSAGQVVNLAFGLIASATVTVIVSAVVRR